MTAFITLSALGFATPDGRVLFDDLETVETGDTYQFACLTPGGRSRRKMVCVPRFRVAVARKLAVILHRMWVDGGAFRFGREPAPSLATIQA
jgi:hypothetical protein